MNWDDLLITVVDPDSFIVTEDEMIYSLQAEQRMIIFTGERGLDGADGKDGYSVHPAGVWMEGTAYNKLDLVSHDGTSYVARQDVPIGVLTSDERYWMISAERGVQGPEGPQGPPGYGAEWGNIGGQIENQADLSAALSEKADTLIIASNFGTSENYSVGDYVIHGGELFRFISDHTGDWDTEHVTAVNIGNELVDRYYTGTEVDGLLNGKVSKTGDTMSGDLEILSGNKLIVDYDDVDAASIPSSNVVRDGITFQGNNVSTFLRLLNMTDGTQGIQFGTDRNGTANAVRLVVDNNGNRKVTVSDSSAWRTGIGAVNKAGDTVTGDLTISHADSNKLYLKPTNGWTAGSYIEARPDSGPSTSGNILLLNGGGNTLVGGGEFSANAYGANVDNCQGTGENLYLGADNATRIYTNAGTIAKRKIWTFGTDGSTTLPAALTIENGGTGATTAAAARTALGLSLTRGAESPSNVSIANNISTVVWEHEFAAGLYLILCTATFASNATGWRYLFMANSSGNGLGGTYQVRARAVDGATTIIGFSGIANLSSNTTYYLRAQQTSGGALTITPRIVWLKFL